MRLLRLLSVASFAVGGCVSPVAIDEAVLAQALMDVYHLTTRNAGAPPTTVVAVGGR